MAYIQDPFQFLTQGPTLSPPPPPAPAYIPQQRFRRPDAPTGPYGLFGQVTPTNDPGVAMYNDPNSQYFSPEAQTIAADYGARMAEKAYPTTSTRDDLRGLFSDPVQALNNHLNSPENIPGFLLSAGGFPMASSLLNYMGSANVNNLGKIQANTEMGVKGYEFGNINGDPYGISPGRFNSRSLSGVVPDWFDINMHDRMLEHQNNINSGNIQVTDPTTQSGYNQKGEYVDQFGNIAAAGLMSDAQALADQNGLSLAETRGVLSSARRGEGSLKERLRTYKKDNKDYTKGGYSGYGFDGKGGYGSGGIDEDAYSDAVTTAAFDAFGAAFDDAAAAGAAAADAADDAASGFGADSEW